MTEELSQDALDLQRNVRKFCAAAIDRQAKTKPLAFAQAASQVPKNLIAQAVCGRELWWA